MRMETHQERPRGRDLGRDPRRDQGISAGRRRRRNSTFGRLVVNDGKLVSRLRDGAKITTGTLDKVRAYLSRASGRAGQRQWRSRAPRKPANGRAVRAEIAPPGFRFFDNRQKYLLFVSTCSEKTEIANRVSLELAICSRRRRRCGCSMPVSATAPCCRG